MYGLTAAVAGGSSRSISIVKADLAFQHLRRALIRFSQGGFAVPAASQSSPLLHSRCRFEHTRHVRSQVRCDGIGGGIGSFTWRHFCSSQGSSSAAANYQAVPAPHRVPEAKEQTVAAGDSTIERLPPEVFNLVLGCPCWAERPEVEPAIG